MLTRTQVVEPLTPSAVLTAEQKIALIEAKIARAKAHSKALAEMSDVKAHAERSLYTKHR